MDITSLEFAVEANGKPKVSVWCKCRSIDDVDNIIAWAAPRQKYDAKVGKDQEPPCRTRHSTIRTGPVWKPGKDFWTITASTAPNVTGPKGDGNVYPKRSGRGSSIFW